MQNLSKKERLEALIRQYSGNKPTQFAKLLGVAPSTISSWIARDTLDYDLVFAKCENISSDWLLSGKGSMLVNEQPEVSLDPNIGKPYYDVDFEGGFDELFNSQTKVPVHNIIIQGFEKADLWCNVTGHSMEPKINHGDIIALHRCSIDDVQYGEIYAVVLDTLRTIKILRRSQDPDAFLFVPINGDYDPQDYPKSRIINIFEVIGSISKFF